MLGMSVLRTTRNFFALSTIGFLALATTALAQEKKIATDSLADLHMTADIITLNTVAGFAGFNLRVKGPDGTIFEQKYTGNEVPFIELFDFDGNMLADGQYTYELVGTPELSDDQRWAMEQIRNGDGEIAEFRDMLPHGGMQSGYFRIEQGAFVLPQEEPAFAPRVSENVVLGKDEVKDGGNSPIDLDGGNRDVVHNDDLIVTRSICVGFDCANGEVFGFDTIRLKENNLRIKFMDTSVGGFPSRDWQLTANDSASGGANKFSIDDIDGGRTPFTIEAGAASHSLYVDDGGRVGLGTSTPVVELHVVNGDTAALRLEQNSSSGFAPQTWDVAGNETSFFIRDASNGSTLPFRIRPGANNNALSISSSSDIGVGTLSPDAAIHVLRSSSNTPASLHLQNTNGTGEASIHVESNSNTTPVMTLTAPDGGTGIQIRYVQSGGGDTWNQTLNGNGIAFTQSGDSENAYQIRTDGSHRWGGNNTAQTMTLTAAGNLTTLGTVNGMSDKNMKEEFQVIDPKEVLATVAEIPITTWKYKNDEEGIRHMGPMAQDFYAAFGLGMDNRHISFADLDGVNLAAIKGLHTMFNEVVAEKNAEIDSLKDRLAKLETLVQKLAQ
jgi:hypothetical protein